MNRWLQTEPPVKNIRIGREGRWATWEISREERAGVCRDLY
jgi:hypothetical protein